MAGPVEKLPVELVKSGNETRFDEKDFLTLPEKVSVEEFSVTVIV